MQAKVFIFRGAPASGKSTLIPEFCKHLPQPVAMLQHDMFRWDIHRSSRPHEAVTADEHLFAFENLKALFERYLIHGTYTIVVEGLFTWNDTQSPQGNVQTLLSLAQKYDVPAVSIVLTADKKVLRQRNTTRGWEVPPEEFEALYHNIYKNTGNKEVVIDSTGQSASATLKAILDRADYQS